MKRPEEVLWLQGEPGQRHSVLQALSFLCLSRPPAPEPAPEPLEGGSVLTAEPPAPRAGRACHVGGAPVNWTQHPAGIRLSSSQRRRPSLSRCLVGPGAGAF